MPEYKAIPLETPKKVKALTDRFYRELREAHEHGKKVAWCVGPVPWMPLAWVICTHM